MDSEDARIISRVDSRKISRSIENAMWAKYSSGMFIPHIIDDSNIEYNSHPDSEVILSSVNMVQSNEFLSEFVKIFRNKQINNASGKSTNIYAIRITYPHTKQSHDIPSPTPYMSDDELKKYIWPGSSINEDSEHYTGGVWIDIGEKTHEFSDFNQDEDGSVTVDMEINEQKWIKVLTWPIMVGSNRCNYNAIRAYINSEESFHDADRDIDTTIGERARYIIEDLFHCERKIPDGYFIIKGRMKKVSTADKLQMNMIYTVGTNNYSSIGDVISEIRSVHPTYGITYTTVFLQYVAEDSASKANKSKIYKAYNSILAIGISGVIGVLKTTKEDKSTSCEYSDTFLNIFDLANFYASRIATSKTTSIDSDRIKTLDRSKIITGVDEGAPILRKMILDIAGEDPDVKRAVDLSYEARRQNISPSTPLTEYLKAPHRYEHVDVHHKKYIDLEVLHRILPHCENLIDAKYDGDIMSKSKDSYNLLEFQEIFLVKMRVIALMAVNAILTASIDSDGKRKLDLTDRKDFSYKRWSTIGYELREYLRSMLASYEITNNNYDSAIITSMKKNTLIRYGSKIEEDGFVEDIPKWNLIAALDSLRSVKISVSDKSGGNNSSARRIHTSQWGQQCPINTPEGKNIGLTNNISEACLISVEITNQELSTLYYEINSFESDLPNTHLLIIDGAPVKVVAQDLYSHLKDLRRNGTINRQIGLAIHKYHTNIDTSTLYVIVVRTVPSRPIFPALILDGSVSKLNAIKDSDGYTFDDYMNEGYVEFLDAYEVSYNCVIAPWIYEAGKSEDECSKYTHCMIKPTHIASQTTNCLSFYSHNPAARGTYASTHIKQAISRLYMWQKYRFDHEINYLNNPEKPLLSSDTCRRIGFADIGYGASISVASSPHYGNNDDGIHFSKSLQESGKLDGKHYSVLNYKNETNVNNIKYNYMLNKDKTSEITYTLPNDNTVYKFPDIEFSNGVITPYGDKINIEIRQLELERRLNLPIDDPDLIIKRTITRTRRFQHEDSKGIRKPVNVKDITDAYEFPDGSLYRYSGMYMDSFAIYNDVSIDSNVTSYKNGEPVPIIYGEQISHIPGRIVVQTPSKYILNTILSDPDVKSLLGDNIITPDLIANNPSGDTSLHGYINTLSGLTTSVTDIMRVITSKYKQFRTIKLGLYYIPKDMADTIDTPFISSIPISLMVDDTQNDYYGPAVAPVPMYKSITGRKELRAELGYIYNKRHIKRGDIAIKTLRKVLDTYEIEKEKFELTEGTIESIGGGNTTKIKTAMPIYPKVGNKYAALYSQKSVCARIVPDDEMPLAKWYNPVLKRNETIKVEAAFNPLSYASRGTTGMLHEVRTAGTVDYLLNRLTLGDAITGSSMQEIYEEEDMTSLLREYYNRDNTDEQKQVFDDIMKYGNFKLDDASRKIDDITDTTEFMYDINERDALVKEIRIAIGLPPNCEFNCTIKDPKTGIIINIETPITVGTVYYVALRHLVDNKRRARGYVGKKDPLTLQPVKGRKHDGGTNFGTMEGDCAKDHGAKAVIYDKLALTSDRKVFLKDPVCGGLLAKTESSNDYRCVDCKRYVDASQIIYHETVNSWNLFRMYCRAIGVEIYDDFGIRPIDLVKNYIKSLNFKITYKHGDNHILLSEKKIIIFVDDNSFFTNRNRILQEANVTALYRKDGMSIIRIAESYINKHNWRESIKLQVNNPGKDISYFDEEMYTPEIEDIFDSVI